MRQDDSVPIPVDDPADPRIAPFNALTDAAWRQSVESEHGFFVAEGRLVLEQVVRLGLRVQSVLALESRIGALPGTGSAPVYAATQAVIDAVAGFHAHRGVLAAVERPAPRSVAEVIEASRHLLAVENVSDHENLGALFRNAAAFGIGAVVLSPGCCDPLYRRAVRVSMGHVLSVPYAYATPAQWPPNLDGYESVALTPAPDAEPLGARPLPDRCALLVGAEGPGLSPAALAAASRRVRIPMAAGVDSLNVATAAAIAMHRLP